METTPQILSAQAFGLYLHIPFCHRICPYCSFYKHQPGDTAMKEFVSALLTETRFQLDRLRETTLTNPLTLYLGGGTPSLLSENHLCQLFEGLQELIDFSSLEEVDLEANPRTFQLSKIQLMKELGVTRVSLGVQSFQKDELLALGRDHSPEEAEESFRTLREAEIPSCNLDLMFSIPHQNKDSWKNTLERALALKPDHISCYNLTYEEDTAYFERFQKGELQDDPELNADLFSIGDEILTAAGYEHYETSNYARSGHQSKHNQSYWQGMPYLGLGPSAVSTTPADKNHHSIRWQNVSDTSAYIQQIQSVGHAMASSEQLTTEQFNLERIALLLRTAQGLPLRYLAAEQNLSVLLAHELALLSDTHLQLTSSGALLVDSIAAELEPATT